MFYCFGIQSAAFSGAQDAWSGSAYHANSAPQYATAIETLGEIALSPSATVLDIGCGSGDITVHLIAPLVPHGHVVGIDMSASMIEFAQKTYTDIPNVSFDVVDVRTWALDGTKYDCAVSFSAFHFIEDVHPVFAAIAQSLNPGGTLLFAMGHKNNFYEQSVVSVASLPQWTSYFKKPMQRISFTHDPESIEKVLAASGFKTVVARTWNQRVTLESKEKFASFTRAWIYALPCVQELPENLRETFIDDIIEHSPIQVNKDGSVDYSTPILIVKAVKMAGKE